jgi:hypothetical protein
LFPEFVEMLFALSDEGVEYVVVGGYAVGVHLEPRATKDIDIFIRPSKTNAKRVMRALARFGAARFDLTERDLAREGIVFQIGIAPRRIDILTSISAVTFDEAWRTRHEVKISGLASPVAFLGRDALATNKRAVGRPQDLADVTMLERASQPKVARRGATRPVKKAKARRKKRSAS